MKDGTESHRRSCWLPGLIRGWILAAYNCSLTRGSKRFSFAAKKTAASIRRTELSFMELDWTALLPTHEPIGWQKECKQDSASNMLKRRVLESLGTASHIL